MQTPVEMDDNDWVADWESRMEALLLANNERLMMKLEEFVGRLEPCPSKAEETYDGTQSGTFSVNWDQQMSTGMMSPGVGIPGARARPPSVIHVEIPENKVARISTSRDLKASSSRVSRSSMASGRSKQSATASNVSEMVFGRMFNVNRKKVDEVSMTSFDTHEEQMHKETLRESQKRMSEEEVLTKSWESGDSRSLSSSIRSLVASWSFEAFFALAIFSNSIFIGIEVHYAAHHVGSAMPSAFFYIDQIYAALFLIELVLRMISEGGPPFFFKSPNIAWNYLDLMINATSVLNLVSAVASTSNQDAETIKASGNMRIIRILRLTRIIRVVRIVKIVRFIRALRSLVHSIFCTMKVLLWSVLLLVMIMYVFAIVFTDVSSEYSRGFEEISEANLKFIREHFLDLERSIMTLFQSICNGIAWGEVADKLNELSRIWGYLYVTYIAFCLFAVLNVMTGMFCQSAIESAERDQELHIQTVLSTKQQQIETFMSMFERLQHDLGRRPTGNLTFMEFEELFCKPHIRSFFEALDVETKDAWTLFNLMDVSGSGDLEASEFVEGCMRLKGPARAIDVSLMIREQRRTRKKLLGMEQLLQKHFGPKAHLTDALTVSI